MATNETHHILIDGDQIGTVRNEGLTWTAVPFDPMGGQRRPIPGYQTYDDAVRTLIRIADN